MSLPRVDPQKKQYWHSKSTLGASFIFCEKFSVGAGGKEPPLGWGGGGMHQSLGHMLTRLPQDLMCSHRCQGDSQEQDRHSSFLQELALSGGRQT